MMKMKSLVGKLLFPLLLIGCAGQQRECSNCAAKNYGADWLIVQYNNTGETLQCWKLNDMSVANEDSSDGIYWEDQHGNLVHISGWYNRVQVANNSWQQAANALRVDLSKCLE